MPLGAENKSEKMSTGDLAVVGTWTIERYSRSCTDDAAGWLHVARRPLECNVLKGKNIPGGDVVQLVVYSGDAKNWRKKDM